MATNRADPGDYLGVYVTLDDVPDRYRLSNYEAEYAGTDVWSKYVDTRDVNSDSHRWKLDKCRREWTAFIADVGRHPALADPDHVEAFVADVRADHTLSGTYETYFGPLYQIYDWLWKHADYPHVYNPVLMAANNGGAAREQWKYRLRIR